MSFKPSSKPNLASAFFIFSFFASDLRKRSSFSLSSLNLFCRSSRAVAPSLVEAEPPLRRCFGPEGSLRSSSADRPSSL